MTTDTAHERVLDTLREDIQDLQHQRAALQDAIAERNAVITTQQTLLERCLAEQAGETSPEGPSPVQHEAGGARTALIKVMHTEIHTLREEQAALHQRLNDLWQETRYALDAQETTHTALVRAAWALVQHWASLPPDRLGGRRGLDADMHTLFERLEATLRAEGSRPEAAEV